MSPCVWLHLCFGLSRCIAKMLWLVPMLCSTCCIGLCPCFELYILFWSGPTLYFVHVFHSGNIDLCLCFGLFSCCCVQCYIKPVLTSHTKPKQGIDNCSLPHHPQTTFWEAPLHSMSRGQRQLKTACPLLSRQRMSSNYWYCFASVSGHYANRYGQACTPQNM